jgi:hypothetical protein
MASSGGAATTVLESLRVLQDLGADLDALGVHGFDEQHAPFL